MRTKTRENLHRTGDERDGEDDLESVPGEPQLPLSSSAVCVLMKLAVNFGLDNCFCFSCGCITHVRARERSGEAPFWSRGSKSFRPRSCERC